MTKEEIAKKIDGSQYPFNPSRDLIESLRTTGTDTWEDIVIVFGASDDLMEFRGAIYDEVDCFDGGTAYLTRKGLLLNQCDGECPYFEELKEMAATIEALWCKEDGLSWTYKTDIPHSTFLILEDAEVYCRGIVFNLSDVKTTDL